MPRGVHRDDLVVETRKATLVFGDHLRIKARLAVARYFQFNLARDSNDRLPAITISPVARLLAGEMVVHLGVQNPLGQGLLQVIEQ
jgi:hypothetical protein